MKKPQVLLQVKGLGEIVLELDHVKAPLTAGHFLWLVDMGYYNQTLFHRICPSYTIAGGEKDVTGRVKPVRRTIRNEGANGLKNVHYSLAMARKVTRDSVGNEFFINTQDNPQLDWRGDSHELSGCPVFGRVLRGHSVVDKISQLPRRKALFQEDQPAELIVVERAVALTLS